MSAQDFIEKILADCKKNSVKFIVGKGKQIRYDNNTKVGGYFSDFPPVLAYAGGHKDFLELLIHESSHMDQWTDKMSLYMKSRKKDDDGIFDKWLAGTDVSKRKINFIIDRIQAIELDCEKRSVEKIKKYGLPVDVESYIRKSNSYIFLYTLIKENRKWTKTGPYRIKEIVDAMPNKFLKDYSKMSTKLKDLYQACYT